MKRTRESHGQSTSSSKKPRHESLCQRLLAFWNSNKLENRRDFASHYNAQTSRLLNLVQEVREHEIIPYLNVKELAMLRPTCKWCNEQWQEFLKRNTFRVPEQVPTIDEAMRVGFNLAVQKVYLKEKPLVVVLSEGEHVVEGSWTAYGAVQLNTLEIMCSNISFIGQGKDKTTVHGEIVVLNKKNVTVKSLTLTNPDENITLVGLRVQGEEASVEMMDVSVKECGSEGLIVDSGASVKATQCEFSENGWTGACVHDGSKGIFTDCTFHHNENYGVWADNVGTLVELQGEQTEIHHNKNNGLDASTNAIINIYIPTRSITALIHDNEGEEDLSTCDGGKIQSQLSSSSLELTIIHEGPPASDDEDEEDY